MKRVKFIINCLTNSIKKKFFKSQKTDISHECEKLVKSINNTTSVKELEMKEYTSEYCITTRWQTV